MVLDSKALATRSLKLKVLDDLDITKMSDEDLAR